ncbi:GNVR domain-containing protein [Spirosoma sp. SC4-14]|uniref:GNVR domain-containing protein n=1 Tax=Spirosoma sp. SC4-14 TaxID=3128900 RepID=UPI0030CDE489
MSVTEVKRKKSIDEDEIEIRLSDIIKFLKTSRRRVIIGTLFGLLAGALYSFSKPDLYTSKVTVMPEIQSKGTGSLNGLGSLAGLAGIDIGGISGGSVDAIRPDIYPDILRSVPFGLKILKTPVYSNLLSKETSLREFIEKSNENVLWSGMDSENDDSVKLDRYSNKLLQITKGQESLIDYLDRAIAADYDTKTGIITVSATFPDAIVAATVAQHSLEYLTDYVSNYRTEKARKQVAFLDQQVREAKERYQASEYALSSYKDRNNNLYLNTAKIEEQRLQADFLLAQNVFNDLSKQFEQAKVKVAEELPIFKVLEPAQVPLRKSAPKRSLIVIGFTFVGAFLGLGFQIVRLLYNTSKGL